ncbi:M4 family metallopeptidase [Amycolatopsis sp. H20-H5]|uniref:M4 family metallopeptidase n=1 Tax=Amycolatopsis sp. H20-H5 TaxID=3046309 RepID=UPI002DB9CDCE|nr:M4 family metallopeptidase [Amycolatopsis sp. H20-H5]MEC3978313.1 M4 family metallopeptidase [Amycolatopsis sp. H20-H5]
MVAGAAAVVLATTVLSAPAQAITAQPSLLQARSTAMPFGSVQRYQQEFAGVPVFGGQIVKTLNRAGQVIATHGKTTAKTTGQFPASDAGAAAAAIGDVVKRTGLPSSGLRADAAKPYWYDATLGGARGESVAVPTYQVVVHGKQLEDKWTEVVDARSRQVLASWSETREAVNRDVCDANRTVVGGSNDSVRCGTSFKVDRAEGGAESSVADVNNVYTFFGQASDFYSKYVATDLTGLIGADYGDGTGKALRGTVRICVQGQCPYANAFWDGEQMAFGEGVTTDDITGHELTHGVTQQTSGLSGGQADSINEGLSDVFGKFIGITSNDPNDTGANRWLLGSGSSLGAIRNMKDPRSSKKAQPDMVNGPGWTTDNPDVHINDGVVNKTDYLITDGDTFNGQTVKGLGLDKSVQIWWGVENTLTPSATFKDVGAALNSSCSALAQAGTGGITADDCTQVANAVLATQLAQDPS